MNCLASYFCFFLSSIFKLLHQAISRTHSSSISLSSFITFSKSSTASSKALLNLRATPLRYRFLTLAGSERRTWLAKVMTISQRLERMQQRARLEQAGMMVVLSISAISPLSIFCWTLCLRMNSKVITAFENYLMAPSWSFSPSNFRPKSQHSCAILRCLRNSCSGDSCLPEASNLASSLSESSLSRWLSGSG